MDVLVTYDIADTETRAGALRLRRVAGVCEKYGARVQFSVFECRLAPHRLARMVGELLDEIDAKRDSVILYRFPGDIGQWRDRMGRGVSRETGDPWIL